MPSDIVLEMGTFVIISLVETTSIQTTGVKVAMGSPLNDEGTRMVYPFIPKNNIKNDIGKLIYPLKDKCLI